MIKNTNTYSCLHKPIKINCKKLYILLLLGQLCTGRVGLAVDHDLATGDYTSTANINDGLNLSGTGNAVNINHSITNPGNHVLSSGNNSLTTTINISEEGTIGADTVDKSPITFLNVTNVDDTITINNSGNISNLFDGSRAIVIGDDTQGPTVIINNSGSINGDISLSIADDIITQKSGSILGDIYSRAGNDTITIDGGSIRGDIHTGAGDDTINLHGGTIIGDLSLEAGNDTINIAGGTLEGNITSIAGNKTIDYRSGIITGNIGSTGGGNVLNIEGTLETNGTIANMQTIEVRSPATFTVNQRVSGVDTLLLNNGNVQVLQNGSIVGTGELFNESGTLILEGNGRVSMGTFRNTGTISSNNGTTLNGSGLLTNEGNLKIMPGANVNFDAQGITNNGNLNLGSLEPLAAGVVDLVEITGNITSSNNAVVTALSPVQITGDYAVQAGSKHIMYIKNGTASTVTANNVGFADGSSIEIRTSGLLANTASVQLAVGSEGLFFNPETVTVTVTGSSPVFTYTTSNDLNNITITPNRQTYANALASITTPSANATAVANVLQNLVALAADPAADPALPQSLALIDNVNSTTEFVDKIDALIPNLSVARAADLSMQSSSMVLEQINDRIAQVSNNQATLLSQKDSGYAAGDCWGKQNYWMKAFGISNRQQALTESKGYNANLGGFALGIDKSVNSKMLLGASLSYASTKVKTKDLASQKARIQSSQVTLYGNYSADKYYVNAYIAAGLNRYKTDREALAQNYHAKFNGIQPSVRLDVGMPHIINNLKITPNASLQYNFLRQQKYSETGAGVFGLQNVSNKNANLLRAGLGAKWEMSQPNSAANCLLPELRAMGFYDVVNTKPQLTTEFQGGGGSIVLVGDKAKKFTVNLGASLNYVKSNGFSMTFSYDLYAKKKFIGHGGSLLAKFSM